jgi:glutamate-5-semialdehyde dehydrogenase
MSAFTSENTNTLEHLTAGMVIPYAGNRFATVSEELADEFEAGDRLYVVQTSGALRRVPKEVQDVVSETVDAAAAAAQELRRTSAEKVRVFYREFAQRLQEAWPTIAVANREDVSRAKQLGRSTTRLEVSDAMRDSMVEGLKAWEAEIAGVDELGVTSLSTVDHGDWQVEERTAPLGVVGFIFEGRPNVFADSAGVLATGNAAVLRIGGDALATAQAVLTSALQPALEAAGLPDGAITLVPSRERSAGWALFSDSRLSLAVVRGSGAAVTELSSIAQQAGIPVSAHGTGGAWMFADDSADTDRFSKTVENSLDRKVCNTLNVAVIVRSRAEELVPQALAAADRAAAARGGVARVHVAGSVGGAVSDTEYSRTIQVQRPEGEVTEPRASQLDISDLGHEWEWEGTPEFSIVVVENLSGGVDLFNRYSSQFVASLIASDTAAQQRFQETINAPFVGDGFTRWVDGQYALNKTELGLSNWERGRMLARSGILTGADLTARRLFAHHENASQHR